MPEPKARDDYYHGEEPARAGSVLGLVRRRFPALLIPVVLAAGAAYAVTATQEERYEASASVLFQDSGTDAPVLASQDPGREAATNVRLLQLELLEDRVEAGFNKPVTGDVDVIAEEESNLVTIIVTDASARLAARVANAYATEYVELRQEAVRDEIEREREAVSAQLGGLSSTAANGPEGLALNRRLQELSITDAASVGARQVGRAEPPSSASSLAPTGSAVIGALVGLVLGVALAIALESRDRRVRDPRHIERGLGGPIIGRIPRSRALAKSKPSTAALPPPEAEAFRTVRANLRHQLKARNARSVLVTSAHPGEGKTTVAWNLARMEAAAGTRVLLVEADLRRPVLAKSLEMDGAPGLSELLAGKEQLQHLVQPVSFETPGTNGNSPHGTIDVLLAGDPPANPAELLDSERMQAVLEVVPDSYDLVVVDTPPTSVVSDAMPILGSVGGVLVVGRIGTATHESIVEQREQFENFDAPMLGVVVSGGAKPAGSHYRYHGSGRGG